MNLSKRLASIEQQIIPAGNDPARVKDVPPDFFTGIDTEIVSIERELIAGMNPADREKRRAALIEAATPHSANKYDVIESELARIRLRAFE